ncbi:MAG: hypothetical protein ACD_70C00133G0001 [uncultured bacterium]|nr:MAG: hypothetical protein ACD_70C00133G0001 [uncultured bacterium]OGT25531.1 MAG: mannose-1-phosphate guanylyltransferase/mannose-6-phosphate isomerase [Gammaproteobacteria bacterium RIFCSPHIGHO2_02_FULL_42_43]OGT28445.1 MAG: mannose-1-phosphate guanylyltransferase/mannose-6-phosphate isomerase [Gammaproteobacteria bacterium RIFCSPHIGHO2_01_FULL_42_8]OGT51485.1 MAG: mannose-1-phosphate guanylyltransferase/mannose-6-phosphate isomerase [Gammaproteobacteria bacterium RIFCSPHIGHO2_12_FULL_41_25]
MKKIHPVILLGGSGTRLWPLSRSNYPKQFAVFSEKYSLFQETVLRLRQLPTVGRIYLMVSTHNYFICLDQLRELAIDDIELLVEPVSRNTAAPIAVIASHIQKTHSSDDAMLVLPSDHHIQDASAFIETVQQAAVESDNKLILFGVKPNRAAIEYGYIEAMNAALPSPVKQFVEKPDESRARTLIENKNMYWNSGMFLFSVKKLLSELRLYCYEMTVLAEALLQDVIQQGNTIYLNKSAFEKMPVISIDVALMEKTHNAVVYALQSDWSDLGDWKAVYDHAEKDENHNVTIGPVLSLATQHSYLRSDQQLLATIGVDHLVVVATKDSVLIANKNETQAVKTLVELLKNSVHHECAKEDLKMYRPWGSSERLIHTKQFQVKHIVVKPGGRLSLQVHHHRTEHWVVVKGVADVVCGHSNFQLHENESTYIPKHTQHRFINSQSTPLHLIEVQVGDSLSEDDIERLDDVYGQIDTLIGVD